MHETYIMLHAQAHRHLRDAKWPVKLQHVPLATSAHPCPTRATRHASPCLCAQGHRALGDAEWAVYCDAALEEWEAGRAAREAEVTEAGASGFFNPRVRGAVGYGGQRHKGSSICGYDGGRKREGAVACPLSAFRPLEGGPFGFLATSLSVQVNSALPLCPQAEEVFLQRLLESGVAPGEGWGRCRKLLLAALSVAGSSWKKGSPALRRATNGP